MRQEKPHLTHQSLKLICSKKQSLYIIKVCSKRPPLYYLFQTVGIKALHQQSEIRLPQETTNINKLMQRQTTIGNSNPMPQKLPHTDWLIHMKGCMLRRGVRLSAHVLVDHIQMTYLCKYRRAGTALHARTLRSQFCPDYDRRTLHLISAPMLVLWSYICQNVLTFNVYLRFNGDWWQIAFAAMYCCLYRNS